MTFFNKKTEVMQIEMTPYGRYLYSIGKFMPHSYEFVDDDVVYRISGSGESQESANSRILNETPKLKINRAFQDEAPQVESPPKITIQRVMEKKNNVKQPTAYPMGRSSYSSEKMPEIQVTMLKGVISGSQMSFDVTEINTHGTQSSGSAVLIPQIDVDFNFIASLKSVLNNDSDADEEVIRSFPLENGKFVEVKYTPPIIHLKEFNSFYEKENFDIQVYKITGSIGEEIMTPLTFHDQLSNIVNDILVDEIRQDPDIEIEAQEEIWMESESEYFFDIDVDDEILQEILCEAVSSLEINSQFLDEELICPDQRTDRFDIYSTRVGPDDLEDCD